MCQKLLFVFALFILGWGLLGVGGFGVHGEVFSQFKWLVCGFVYVAIVKCCL